MPQDWFAANAPKTAEPPSQDWFAANAPKVEPMAPVASHGPAPARRMTFAEAKAQMDPVAAAQIDLGGQIGAANMLTHGPDTAVQGVKDIAQGNYARGASNLIRGGGETALLLSGPSILGAAARAPLSTALKIGAGAGAGVTGQAVGSGAASALGATEDQARLAGDVTGLAAGTAGVMAAGRAGQKASELLATRATARDTGARTALRQAVPPTTSHPYSPEDEARALKYFKLQHSQQPIQNVESYRDAATRSIQMIESHIGRITDQYPTDVIRTNPLQAAIETLQRSPRGDAVRKGLSGLQDLGLDQPLTLSRAEAIRRQLNAEMSATLTKNRWDVGQARAKDPRFAAKEAAAKALRDGIYGQLEARGVDGVRSLRRDEGALMAIRDATEAQIYRGQGRIAGTGTSSTTRRMIADLATSVPVPGSKYAAGIIAKPNLTRDQMIERAFSQMQPVEPPAMPTAPKVNIRGALPAGATTLGPAEDTSFVRGVPAMPAHSYREGRALPEGRGAKPEMHLTGEVLPAEADTSKVSSVTAQPLSYDVDATVPVKQGGVKVRQYSGDPNAERAGLAPELRSQLKRMLADLDTFEPEKGRLIRDPVDRNSSIYAPGTAGSAVGDDIRVISEQNVSNRAIKRAIRELLGGKMPTNRLHTAALDAAKGYLEKRPGYRGPIVPGSDDEFDAFSRMVDDFARSGDE